MAARAGLDAQVWTPRELRHSFVSLLSDAGVSIEEIARLVGHRGTVVTEAVYRKQLRPVITEGAEAMDRIFGQRRTRIGRQASRSGSIVTQLVTQPEICAARAHTNTNSP